MSTKQGTFTNIGNPSQAMPAPEAQSSNPTFKLSTVGCDASNTIKSQKSINLGIFVGPAPADSNWTDVTTYNSEQTNTVISPAVNETYRLVAVAMQAAHQIQWRMTRES